MGSRRRVVTVAGATVVAPTAPTLTAPATGTDVYDGVGVTVTATVTAGQVPDRIDFVLDPGVSEVVVATDSSSPYSQTWTPSGVTPGAHTLVARFVYGSGSVDSASINLTVMTPQTVQNASDLTAAGWTEVSVTPTDFQTLTDSLDGAPALHYTSQAALTAAAFCAMSVDVKAGTKTWAWLACSFGVTAYVNLSTGALGTVSGGTATTTALGSGWHRILLSGTTNGTPMAVGLASGDGGVSYQGAGTGTILATNFKAWKRV